MWLNSQGFFPSNSCPTEVRLLDFLPTANKKKKVTPQEVLMKHRNSLKQTQQLGFPCVMLNNMPMTDVEKYARIVQKRQEVIIVLILQDLST